MPLTREEELELQELEGEFGQTSMLTPEEEAELVSLESEFGTPQAITPADVQSDVAGLALAEEQAGIQPPQDELTLGQAGRLAIENFIPSAQQFGSDIFRAVKSPKQTAKAFGDLVSGTAQLLIPGEQGEEDVARAFGKFMSDRYGSAEAMKRTLAEDPVGFAADLSTFVTGVGAITGVAGKAGQLSKIAQIKKAADIVVKSGQGIRRVGTALDPIGLASESARQIAKARGPINSLAKTALNIKADVPVRTVDRIAQEFMDRGLNVNRRSLAKLDKNNRRLNEAIQKTITKSAKSNTVFEADDIIRVVDELKENAAREGLSATDLKTLDNLKEDFGLISGKKLTPSQVQNLKVGFNKAYSESLTDQFGAIRAKFFDKARIGTKTQLESVWPDLKNMNLEEGMGIELSELINKSINTTEKSPFFRNLGLIVGGLGGGIVSAGGDAMSGIAFAFNSAVIGNMLSNPANGVRIARIINKARKVTQATPMVTRPAFQAGRVERVTEKPESLLTPQITQ